MLAMYDNEGTLNVRFRKVYYTNLYSNEYAFDSC